MLTPPPVPPSDREMREAGIPVHERIAKLQASIQLHKYWLQYQYAMDVEHQNAKVDGSEKTLQDHRAKMRASDKDRKQLQTLQALVDSDKADRQSIIRSRQVVVNHFVKLKQELREALREQGSDEAAAPQKSSRNS